MSTHRQPAARRRVRGAAAQAARGRVCSPAMVSSAVDGRIVDDADVPVMLRGVGLGNWLLPEGYMWRFEPPGARRYRDEPVVAGYDLLNEPLPNEFQHIYRDDLIALYHELTAAIPGRRSEPPDHLFSPCSVVAPPEWKSIVDYSAGNAPRPDPDKAWQVLTSLLDAFDIGRCEYRQEVVNAILRRAPLRLAATGFSFRGEGVSYQTTDAQPNPGFRSDERATIVHTGPPDSPRRRPQPPTPPRRPMVADHANA